MGAPACETLTRRSAAPMVLLGRISEVTCVPGRSLMMSSGRSAPVELDLAYASLDDADFHLAIAYCLLREVCLREEVATRTVEGAYFGRCFVEALEIELFADELLDD